MHSEKFTLAKKWAIIIPARNEETNIARCLTSIMALAYDLAQVEIIIADNGSIDRTVSVARTYSGPLDITVLIAEGVPVGALRNLAAKHAAAPLLSFLDADCAVTPNWLHSADNTLKLFPEAIVGAYYSLPELAGWPARIWYSRFHDGRSGSVSYIPGGNLLMKKATFVKAGGFDAALRSNEDSEFCSRALAQGTPVLVFPSLAAIHFGAEKTLREFCARQWWHGSNVINRAGFKANSRAVGIAAYSLLCLAVLIVAAIAGQPGVSFTAAAALAGPPLWLTLCSSRMRAKPFEAAALFLLVLVYALVRALVLPLALARSLRRSEPAFLSEGGPAGGQCT